MVALRHIALSVLVLTICLNACSSMSSNNQTPEKQTYLPSAEHSLETAFKQALESAGQRELGERAVALFQAGKYSEAVVLGQRGLEPAEKVLGPDHPNVATVLIGIGVGYTRMGAYVKAEPVLTRALAISEKALDPDHPQVATALNFLADLYRHMGAYAKAEPLLTRALRISEKTLGPEHLQVETDLVHLALLYAAMGDYAKAMQLNQRALPIVEKALGKQHFYTAAVLNNMAHFHHLVGEYAKAETVYQQALAILEKGMGLEHPSVASVLSNLADLYDTQGDFSRAESLRRQALAIHEKALGPDHPAVADNLNSLANLYRSIGDVEKALPLARRALDIRLKALGPEHPGVADSLNTAALFYEQVGQPTKAVPLHQRALAIRERAFGSEHPMVAASLNNLAAVYSTMSEYEKAVLFHQRALAIREKVFGPEHPDVAQSLGTLAFVFTEMGDYTKAEPLYQRALRINEKALGSNHPSVAFNLMGLGALYTRKQDWRAASEFYKKSLTIQDQEIRNIFAFTTETQKLNFVQSIPTVYNAFLSLIHQYFRENEEMVRDGLGLVLRRKGIVFDAESRSREALQGHLSEGARQKWERLSALRADLAKLWLNKPGQMSAEGYRKRLSLLHEQIKEIEQGLASESALVAQELQLRDITVKSIARGLPPNSALVEFVKIRDCDFVKVKCGPALRYLVFILTASGNVALVDLGEAGALEAKAQRVLTDIRVSMEVRGLQVLKDPSGRSPVQQSLQSLRELYAQVWMPLEKSLGNADKIVVSPDGLLNLVPLAALIDGEGRVLLERYRLAYVSSGRELVAVDEAALKPESDLLLVANPAFDRKVRGAGKPEASLRAWDFRGVFTPLPGTEREAKEIPPLVTGQEGQKRVLDGINATEHTVKTARSPRILHLATHGFFLQDEEIDLCGETRGVTVVKKATPEEKALCEKRRGVTVLKKEKPAPSKQYENPLVRSGLAFAGANKASEITEGDDGILTALEITGMDLYGTELVVLSACDTGVGEVKTGEGVFGLRRAFALAGAKNLMMSLWPVADEVTANQMKTFYQNLQKLPPAEALRQAQLETIRELKAREGVASPGLWAPFILQGAQAIGQ